MKPMRFATVASVALLGFLAVLSSRTVANAAAIPAKNCPPGPSGTLEHRWAPALKQAIGTSRSQASPVWFTVAENVLTEVFYPRVDTPQVGDLQFIVTDGSRAFADQKNDTVSNVQLADEGMAVEIRGKEKNGLFVYQQEIVTDPARPVLRSRLRFKFSRPGMRAFLLFKPAIRNSGAGDRGTASPEALVATEGSRASTCGAATIRGTSVQATESVFAALVPQLPFARVSAGFVGLDDGWQLLRKDGILVESRASAGPGNIALTGEIPASAFSSDGLTLDFDFALAFGGSQSAALREANQSFESPFSQVRATYEAGWSSWLESLANRSRAAARVLASSPMTRLSAAVLKMHEDKASPGALVAALGKPGIPEGDRAGDHGGGYHLVWPRDLYHAAMGLLSVGDVETPRDILRYLIRTQRSDGSWAQNFWVDGTPYWTSLQLDEVSFPILLASKLDELDLLQGALRTDALTMIGKAATFIENNGPFSPQDRWEEVAGYIPSTIAAEIAALRSADRLGGKTIAPTAAATANAWDARIEEWTVSRRGPLGRQYFIRTSPSGKPDAREELQLANGAGRAVAESIIDGGFLELVRLGVRRADNSAILSTLTVYEDPGLSVASYADPVTGARGYRRYNRDFYGHAREGGFWPLLTGERGMHWLAFGDRERAFAHLELLEGMSLPSGMIPEQVRSVSMPGNAGAGVACPLAWAHAEALVLRRSLVEGKPFDRPLAK